MKKAVTNLRLLLPYLPPQARRYMLVYSITSSLLALLDVAAIMLLALSMSSMLAGTPVDLPFVGAVPPSGYVTIIGVVALLIFSKSALQLLQQWRATRRFASFELEIGTRLFDAYIQAPWVERLGRTTSQVVRMADVGVGAINSGFLMPVMNLPSLTATSLSIVAVLIVADPFTALITMVYLGLIAVLLYVVLSRRSVEAGRVNRDYSFKVAALMTDMVTAMKEITLRDKATEVAQVVRANREHSTRARANIAFIGSVPKFILDTALVGGFILVGGGSYLIDGDFTTAIAAVAIFAVSGMRLIPALTGFQSTINTVTANQAQVEAVIRDLGDADRYRENAEDIGNVPLEGTPRLLKIDDISFTYPNRELPALNNVSFEIPIGSSVGLVGASGSGKTTLVDVILGLLLPQSGAIYVDDQNLVDVLGAWRTNVGYVPQEVALFDGTIAQNVSLSWTGATDDAKVEDCLRKAQLWDAIQEREGGVNAKVGERGISFSGGQRQRLGIARALYTSPLILVLDEATSALDTRTEADVTDAIQALEGDITVISVAHRLTTIRNADIVCYFESGFLMAQGTFDEVVDAVPSFHEQARLAGLA